MCNDYRAVSTLDLHVGAHHAGGYYHVTAQHRHKGAESIHTDRVEQLTWEELCDVLERLADDNRPNFRHHALLPEQASFTF